VTSYTDTHVPFFCNQRQFNENKYTTLNIISVFTLKQQSINVRGWWLARCWCLWFYGVQVLYYTSITL